MEDSCNIGSNQVGCGELPVPGMQSTRSTIVLLASGLCSPCYQPRLSRDYHLVLALANCSHQQGAPCRWRLGSGWSGPTADIGGTFPASVPGSAWAPGSTTSDGHVAGRHAWSFHLAHNAANVPSSAACPPASGASGTGCDAEGQTPSRHGPLRHLHCRPRCATASIRRNRNALEEPVRVRRGVPRPAQRPTPPGQEQRHDQRPLPRG
jgi:hypothetical protein